MFEKATKAGSFLRCALFGPSGSGKTYSALRIATGLGGRIAVLDTERGSARKYSDRFTFDVCELKERTIEDYAKVITAAGEQKYKVLIIDSMTHAWREILNEVDRLAGKKGNRFSPWAEVGPKQQNMIDLLLAFPGHIIATMRSKTEWEVQANEQGKKVPVRIGLAPEQGKGIEYEFDLLIELSQEHMANVTKDRTGKYQDKQIDRPGEDFGRELAEWLNSNEAPTPSRVTKVPPPPPSKF